MCDLQSDPGSFLGSFFHYQENVRFRPYNWLNPEKHVSLRNILVSENRRAQSSNFFYDKVQVFYDAASTALWTDKDHGNLRI